MAKGQGHAADVAKDREARPVYVEAPQVLPSMSLSEATTGAGETFADANDLDPESAAEIYALELPPSELGSPED